MTDLRDDILRRRQTPRVLVRRVLGIPFYEMTTYDRYAFAGATSKALIHDSEEGTLIFEDEQLFWHPSSEENWSDADFEIWGRVA